MSYWHGSIVLAVLSAALVALSLWQIVRQRA
jgi:hypothetical protein